MSHLVLWFAIVAQALTSQQVSQAIAEGVRLKSEPHKIGLIIRGADGGFDVMLRGPMDRVATVASSAAARYQEPNPSQVREAATDGIGVTVQPKPPVFAPYSGRWTVTPAATHVVLKTASGRVVQPVSCLIVPVAFTNAAGGAMQGAGAEAWFASLPEGEFDVVVTTADQSVRTYRVKAKDRAKVR